MADIIIPILGIGLAYHDIVLTTPTGKGKRYLTVPKHRAAYGHTAAELKMRGWKIFRPGTKECLLGYRQKGDKPEMLFALAEAVKKRMYPRLLPSNTPSSATTGKPENQLLASNLFRPSAFW